MTQPPSSFLMSTHGKKRAVSCFYQRSGYFIQQLENNPLLIAHFPEFKWLFVKSHFVTVKTLCSQVSVAQWICFALENAH